MTPFELPAILTLSGDIIDTISVNGGNNNCRTGGGSDNGCESGSGAGYNDCWIGSGYANYCYFGQSAGGTKRLTLAVG